MMRELDDYEAEWITAAGKAFQAIRNATGYQRTPDVPTTFVVNQLADMLHNIGTIGTGNKWWRDYHTQERLDLLHATIQELEQSHHQGRQQKSGLLARVAKMVSGEQS